MSVQRKSVPTAKEADLETTAELPVLDVAAYETALSDEHAGSTDTWHMPALQLPSAAAVSAPAPTTDERTTQLEVDLRSLSESLRDVEGRLTRKGERLLELERELASARTERVAAGERAAELLKAAEERAASLVAAGEERAASLLAELNAARSQLADERSRIANLQATVNERESMVRAHETRDHEVAAQLAARNQELTAAQRDLRDVATRATQYLESLHTLEGRRVIFDEQLLGLDSEVEQRDVQIVALREQLSTESVRARDLATDLADRRQRVEVLEREVSAVAGTLAQRTVELGQSERAKSKLQESVNSLTETLGARVERIRVLEAAATNIDRLTRERDIVTAKAASLETSLAAANAALAEKENALRAAADSRAELERRSTDAHAELEKRSTETRTELEKKFAASQLRVEEIDRELIVARAEIAERMAATLRIEAERDEQINRFAASEARSVELESRADEQAQSIHQLQEELRLSLNRNTELEGDLRAAEDAINRIEVELRTKGTKLEDLTRTHEEWRSTIETARQSLAQRDSLINRLETEAANSAALLGNIQQSIKRLDPAAQSGPHPEIAPEGAVRLLIRTDGDSEVVHVLGRKTSVGRTPDNDLQIDAKFISRNHAVILAGPNHTIIEDLNSTNGVAVNGRRIARHTLRDGDSVSIGKTTFRFAVRPMVERR